MLYQPYPEWHLPVPLIQQTRYNQMIYPYSDSFLIDLIAIFLNSTSAPSAWMEI